jgi:dolichol-phosphate mannosyltransferase
MRKMRKKEKLSVVIPTLDEADNIASLIKKVHKVCDAEIIVVDDNSKDGTSKIVKDLAKKDSKIRILVRRNKRGLSSAVLDGIKIASGNLICVMDADHSHPPELIPRMRKEMQNADFVLGSRYVKGGGIENWPFSRKIMSKFATLLAKPLVSVKDPMSGFFMFRKKIINGIKLQPKGFKIALEILVKGKHKAVKEIPFVFKDRQAGKSKLGVETNIHYIGHLVKLYSYKHGKRK